MAIQEEPLATIDQLAEKTGISKPTVAKRLKLLEGNLPKERVGNHPEGRYFTVTPKINNKAIGLEYFGVICEISKAGDIKRIEKLVDVHPYTQYRARCFGKQNGLFLQFRIPAGTKPLLIELLDELQNMNYLGGYTQLPPEKEPPVYTTLSIKGWNPTKMSWDFDWDRWLESKIRKRDVIIEKQKGNALEWIMKKDVHIIHEVMGGARRKNLEIIQALNRKGVDITPQTFSRRYKMIQQECFNGYRTNFDPTIFDVYNSVIITGNGDRKCLRNLRDRLVSNPIPFASTLRVSDDHLFWYLRLQSLHLSNVLARLHGALDDMSVYVLDYSSSLAYYVWPEAFDGEQRRWKTGHAFIVDEPLNAIK